MKIIYIYLGKTRFNKLFITLNIKDIMSLANNAEYIGNCKFCKDHLSLDYISYFKTSQETDFYFCSLGHYWTVKDTSEQPQTITNSEAIDLLRKNLIKTNHLTQTNHLTETETNHLTAEIDHHLTETETNHLTETETNHLTETETNHLTER